MLKLLVYLSLVAFASAGEIDWRLLSMLAGSILTGGLVMLGLVLMFALKVVRGGEREWMTMFEKACQNKKFRDYIEEICERKDAEFTTLIKDSIRESIEEHDREQAPHQLMRHAIIDKMSITSAEVLQLEKRLRELEWQMPRRKTD